MFFIENPDHPKSKKYAKMYAKSYYLTIKLYVFMISRRDL